MTKLILGDTAISAIEQTPPRRRRFFGRRKTERSPLTHCENCGAQLQGHWCAQCGQPAIDYRRSFRHVIADLLNEFLNWDSKFFATIGLLIVRPWKLTNQFLAGHRVRSRLRGATSQPTPMGRPGFGWRAAMQVTASRHWPRWKSSNAPPLRLHLRLL